MFELAIAAATISCRYEWLPSEFVMAEVDCDNTGLDDEKQAAFIDKRNVTTANFLTEI